MTRLGTTERVGLVVVAVVKPRRGRRRTARSRVSYTRRIEDRIPNPSRRSERGSETERDERLINDLIFRIFFVRDGFLSSDAKFAQRFVGRWIFFVRSVD